MGEPTSSEAAWIVEQTIADLQHLMVSGERSAAEITDAHLARIAALDDDLGSVVEVNPDARAIAAALDDERRSGTSADRCTGFRSCSRRTSTPTTTC